MFYMELLGDLNGGGGGSYILRNELMTTNHYSNYVGQWKECGNKHFASGLWLLHMGTYLTQMPMSIGHMLMNFFFFLVNCKINWQQMHTDNCKSSKCTKNHKLPLPLHSLNGCKLTLHSIFILNSPSLVFYPLPSKYTQIHIESLNVQIWSLTSIHVVWYLDYHSEWWIFVTRETGM